MRKQLAEAISKRSPDHVYALVGETFFWTLNGETSEQFDRNRDALHNFKVAFGSDSRDESFLWVAFDDASSAPALFPLDGHPGVLCGPLGAEPDHGAMDQAIERIENGNDSEWFYSLGQITLTEKPGNGGAVEKVAKLAMPVAATHPPTQALGNNPLPTHYQLLLPSGKTGWVDVKAVQPLAIDRLCYGKGADGAWKIVGYEQSN